MDLDVLKNIILVENLYKNYGNFSALENINLKIQKSSTYGIIGLSGAGKTSLLRIMIGLEKASGSVFVSGKDILKFSEEDLKEFRKKIGVIFQHFNLLSSKTVFKNVSFALECFGYKRQNTEKRVLEILDLVGLQDKKNNYPSELSGGQKQRVAIARALVNNPSILFSDESTSALDNMISKSILDLIKKLQKDLSLTVVLISHEIEVIKYMCDNLCVLKDGKLLEEGSKDDVFENPKNDYTKKLITHSYF